MSHHRPIRTNIASRRRCSISTRVARAALSTSAAARPATLATARPNPITVAVARVLAARRIIVPFIPIRLAAATSARGTAAESAENMTTAAAEAAILQRACTVTARLAA